MILKNGGYKEGLKIYPPEELPCDAIIYIANKNDHEEIKHQLLSLGHPQDHLIDVGAVVINCQEIQYFDLPYLPKVERECFVDAGVLDGATSMRFLKWAGERVEHVYCFEPDTACAKESWKNLADIAGTDVITIVEKALWSKPSTLHFTMGIGRGCSRVADTGVDIEATSLDEAIGDKRVTFIKMDIEGSESEAIKGAAHIIRTQRPKLAICLYHRPEDIIELPALVLSLVPDYRLYMRHYTFHSGETILYAV